MVFGEVTNIFVFVMFPLNSFVCIFTLTSPDAVFSIFLILVGSTSIATTLFEVSFRAPHLMRLLSMLHEIGSSM